MWVIIIIFSIGVIIGIGSVLADKERKENLTKKMASVGDFSFTQKIEDTDEHRFVVGIDATTKKVLFVTPEMKRIVDYSQISSVELVSNGVTVASRSLSSLLGASLVGGVVGAMSVSQKIQEKANNVSVKVSLRDINNPFITLVCLDEMQDVKTNEWPYKNRIDRGKKIIDLLKIVMDEVEFEQKQKSVQVPSAMPANNRSIADEITKLAELKEKGLLTEEEFAVQKKKLLNQDNTPIIQTATIVANSSSNPTIPEQDTVDIKLLEYIKSGHKLEAVKYYKETTNCDLKSAKEHVDKLAGAGSNADSGCAVLFIAISSSVAGILAMLY